MCEVSLDVAHLPRVAYIIKGSCNLFYPLSYTLAENTANCALWALGREFLLYISCVWVVGRSYLERAAFTSCEPPLPLASRLYLERADFTSSEPTLPRASLLYLERAVFTSSEPSLPRASRLFLERAVFSSSEPLLHRASRFFPLKQLNKKLCLIDQSHMTCPEEHEMCRAIWHVLTWLQVIDTWQVQNGRKCTGPCGMFVLLTCQWHKAFPEC